MEPDKIDYFDAGEDNDFLEIGVRDRKMKLFVDFLIKAGIEFKVVDFDKGRIIELGEGIECLFFDAGRIIFQLNEDFKEIKE